MRIGVRRCVQSQCVSSAASKPHRRPVRPTAAMALPLLLAAVLLVGAAAAPPPNATALPQKAGPLHCSSVRHALLGEKGFGDIPREPIPGSTLKVCAPHADDNGLTCCTARMETAVAASARQQFDKSLENALSGKLASVLRSRATKFNDFFIDLLVRSKKEFHDMFKKTYGVLYEQNQFVFTDLFDNLEAYFIKGRTRLDRALDKFFNNLYQKLFQVFNSQYTFDDKYLACVTSHMPQLRPFGDVPHKLALQVKRSFVATRTFAQALSISADVANDMKDVPPPPDCSHALTRMSGCNVCQGRPGTKACSGFCSNVMRGCLAYHSEIDTEWNSFVDAFTKISERLMGPFNIEVVVEPINIKISEAIMNFQENGAQISNDMFSKCGKPRLGKRSAATDDKEIQYGTLNFGKNGRMRGQAVSEGTPLEKLINDTMYKVKDTRNFWSLLPLQMCNDDEVAASPKQDNNCWNGHSKARYTKMVVGGSGIAEQADNPEVKVSSVESSRHSGKLSEQMYNLRMLVSKLRSAYNGQDVDWGNDDEEDGNDDTYSEGSGGSGDSPIYSSGDGGRSRGPIDQEGSGDDEYYAPPPPMGDPTRTTVAPPPQTGRSPTSAAPPTVQKASVTKAVVTYLFPIVVVWLGGMFSDW